MSSERWLNSKRRRRPQTLSNSAGTSTRRTARSDLIGLVAAQYWPTSPRSPHSSRPSSRAMSGEESWSSVDGPRRRLAASCGEHPTTCRSWFALSSLLSTCRGACMKARLRFVTRRRRPPSSKRLRWNRVQRRRRPRIRACALRESSLITPSLVGVSRCASRWWTPTSA